MLLFTTAIAAPAPLSKRVVSSTASAIPASETVLPASDSANNVMWNPVAGTGARPASSNTSTTEHQPIRGALGATIVAQQNKALQQQNPDALAPPTTDSGVIPGGNIKWPMSLSPIRLQTGGWARQQNIKQMPIATSMAGVNMRLEAGAIRELHWHKTAEWAYVLSGYLQVTAVDQDGQNYMGNVGPGDLWFFPPGIPHSLQATSDNPDGAEFLLVFDNGDFSDDSTFQLTDWLAHTPKEILAKNFGTTIAAWDDLPGKQLYIFPGVSPSSDASTVEDPLGEVPNPYTFKMSNMTATQLPGGSVKIVDSRTFPAASSIAVADVTVEPGAMRSGNARITEFASSSIAQTYDFQAGDVGFIPATYGHYVENIGNDTLHFLEVFNTDVFQDVSLMQWLALIPPQLVQAHLQISDEIITSFKKAKQIVVGPN
ncbi:uncharacterized protein FIBRA_07155 [Fibroporia radiculosa]|uniref:Cupin type-1 domain-containing protein n=1 Tax=Fibroporia radiculosa TaxID=599839 RepID=J4GDM1_9APHY|nr:uncharacterized protein FIBRA_07155 [Fibroporia radiculosa]CCM04958.1 predicted protein [Fibroporia radiculosa]